MRIGQINSILLNAPATRRVRIVVADPFPIFMIGMRKIIEDDPRLQIVGELSNMPLLLETIIAEVPDVAIVDWLMASQDLHTTTVLLRPNRRKTSLLFVTSSNDAENYQNIKRLGACHLVSKCATASELQTAVWGAWKRSTWSTPLAPEKNASGHTPVHAGTNQEQRFRQLTQRQRQLIPLVCEGMKNKAIAEHLGIAESTVWHHLTAVFTKLQVDDRMGLAALAYKQGLVVATARPGSAEQLELMQLGLPGPSGAQARHPDIP